MKGAVATWDCASAQWQENREAKVAWLASQGLQVPAMYRAEFYDEPPRARVFCYALNKEGRKHLTHEPGACTPAEHGPGCVAREEPRLITLTALPPAGLR